MRSALVHTLMLIALVVVGGWDEAALARGYIVLESDLILELHAEHTAHATLRIVFDPWVSSPMGTGRKLLGRSRPTALVARDESGAPLPVEARRYSDGEWLLEFGLPAERRNGDHFEQAIVMEFDQELEVAHAWGKAVHVVPWAHDTMLGPTEERIRVVSEGDVICDTTCRWSKEGYACSSERPFPVLQLATGPPSFWRWAADIVPPVAAIVACVALAIRALRRLRDDMIRRGVDPEDAAAKRQEGYRAPPSRAPLTLALSDVRRLRYLALVGGVVPLTAFAPMLWVTRSPVPVGVASAIVILVAALFMVLCLRATHARLAIAATPPVVVGWLVAYGPIAALVAAGGMLVVYVFALAVSLARADAREHSIAAPSRLAQPSS